MRKNDVGPIEYLVVIAFLLVLSWSLYTLCSKAHKYDQLIKDMENQMTPTPNKWSETP